MHPPDPDPTGPPESPTNPREPERDLFGRTPRGRPDWSHRRGEPRLFAIVWMMYLMGASILMLAATGASRAIAPSVVRPAAVAMLVAAFVGITVLWPMTRLSQDAPLRAWRAVAQDLVVILIPTFALIAPQRLWFLAHWPADVLWALAGAAAAWGVLTGAVLAIALTAVRRARGAGGARVVFMCVILAMVGGGAIASALGRAEGGDGLGRTMWSPISSVVEITRPREGSGRAAGVDQRHQRALGIVLGCGVTLWLGGAAVAMASRRESAY